MASAVIVVHVLPEEVFSNVYSETGVIGFAARLPPLSLLLSNICRTDMRIRRNDALSEGLFDVIHWSDQ